MEIDYLISSIKFGYFAKSQVFLGGKDYSWYFNVRNNYDYFLLQKLEPWMFVPCKEVGGKWVFLEEPKNFLDYQDAYNSCEKDSILHAWYMSCNQYQEAKERVLFEGFEYYKDFAVLGSSSIGFQYIEEKSIESLLQYPAPKIKLTNTAKKRINP